MMVPKNRGGIIEEGRKENTAAETLLFFQFNAQPVGRTEGNFDPGKKSNEEKGDNNSDNNNYTHNTYTNV